jgi:CrcB protein
MDGLNKVFLVGAGGFLGANARYWLSALIQERVSGPFPWGTLLINVSGSLVMGIFMGLFIGKHWDANWRLIVAVGILGGYTTFSAFSYESIHLLEGGRYMPALYYILGSVVLSLAAVWLGFALTKGFVQG